MSKKPKRRHRSCTIPRTFVRTHSMLNLATGESTEGRNETVTEPCGSPLFGDREAETGVCRSCAKGWEVPDNRFANDQEKARAIAQGD